MHGILGGGENICGRIHDGAITLPGDNIIMKVKQVNSQSDLISVSSFAGPFYLKVRSSVCIILI